MQKKSNTEKDKEKKAAENNTDGDAKKEAEKFADQECARFTDLCGDAKKNRCVRKGTGYKLELQDCVPNPTAKTCPAPGFDPRPIGPNEVAYTCIWKVVQVECTCKKS